MTEFTVLYHHEDGLWWAETPQLEEFVAGANTLPELQVRVCEGLAFFTEDAVELVELFKAESEFEHGSSFSVCSTGLITVGGEGPRNVAAASPPGQDTYRAVTSRSGRREEVAS